jgi:uncharacterized protein YukE
MADAAPFTVSPDSLTTLAGKISSLAGELNGVVPAVRGGDAAAAGDAGLEQTIREYLNCWSSGLAGLCELLDQFQQALTSAAGGYSGSDSAVSKGLAR